jgi:curli biogenesis system outer membrane secretion channel CsgG
VPIGFTAARKIATTGQTGLLLTPEESGFRVRIPGTASAAGLLPGDLLLLVDGAEARALPDPVGSIEGDVELTVLRDGQLLRLQGRVGASPWDTRYFLLLLVGIAFVVAAGLLAAIASSTALAAKPRVAVIEFKDKTQHYSWYRAGEAAQDMLVTELVKSGKYRVIEREQLAAIMQEKNLSLSGEIDPKTAVKAGKLLGVEYIVTGALTELGVADRGARVPGVFGIPSVRVGSQKMDAAIDARMINTTTGEIVWADSAKESTSDAQVFVAGAGGGVDDKRKLDRVLRPVVVKLAESMGKVGVSTSGLGGASDASGIAGKIAKVEGGSVFLNVGAEAGVKEGDTFDVYRVGNVIKDPDTGEVLGSDETKVGRVKITKVMGARLSTASVVSGNGFKPGDMIKN